MPTHSSSTNQSQQQVLLKKFQYEVLHNYQASGSVTQGRCKEKLLDAFSDAIPKMGTVEFKDVPRGAVTPVSEYTPVSLEDRLVFVGWKSLQNIRRLDHDIEAHITFTPAFKEEVSMAKDICRAPAEALQISFE